MIRVLTASTEYIDDLDAAVKDIKTQLDCEHTLLKNSAGIIACHYEFALSGAVAAIGKALPFDTLGSITSANGTAGKAEVLLLTVMVLTSDDIQFKTVLTPSIKQDAARIIEETYLHNTEPGKRPALLLSYAPFMLTNSGDEYIQVLSRASGGVPCFGTLAIDDTPDFHNCFMLHNGEYYSDRMSLLLAYGNVQPRFFLASISNSKVLDRSALITSSSGHVLKEVNDKPVIDYFESMGLTKASETSYALSSLPFMLDYGDGTPLVARVFITLNGEKQAVCAGAMPEGSTLYMAAFDKEDVLLTSGNAVREVLQSGPASGMLIYSCLSRSMTLGNDQFAETDLVAKEAGGKVPFMMAYSGGEMCPTQVKADAAVNRFHNNTFIVCLFQ